MLFDRFDDRYWEADMSSIEELTVGGSAMKTYVGLPAGTGPHPAMVVMCHGAGIDEFTKDRVDQLAKAGYAAAAPDVFHRIPEITDSAEKRASMTDGEIADDINATVDFIQAHPNVDGSRIGIIGHCMGGRMSFLGAIVSPAIKACVVFYSGNMMKTWGEDTAKSPYDRLDEIACPVIGFFGLEDENPSPADVDQIEHRLKELNVDCTFYRYESAGHAFQNFLAKNKFRQGPSDEAWAHVLDFLKENLG
jgi:carboxymethylenebutenolidase